MSEKPISRLKKRFFVYIGPKGTLDKLQEHRLKVKLNPDSDRIYSNNHTFWEGPINDGLDRGPNPYLCPIGWR